MTLLALRNLHKRFGALTVTNDLSLELADGEALGVLGPNGAGKTTMFNLITGDVTADAGSIEFNGQDITRAWPAERCKAGIGRTYQIPQPFTGMTVFENLLVGAGFGAGINERHAADECMAILERVGLAARANELAGGLRLLDRKRLELARALSTRPRLLLLDEIAGGLTEHETHSLIETIRSVRDGGVSIIWIEHVVHALMAVAERVIAMHLGTLLADGTPDEVMASKAVQEVYMGVEDAV